MDQDKLAIVKLIAENTGWRGADLATAVAIALRESNLRPDAFNGNRNTGDESYGLFQINMLGSMGDSRLKSFGLTDKNQLLDPATNARAAYAMWKAQKWHPWLGYRAGLTIAPQQSAANALVQQAATAGYIPADYVGASAVSGGLGESRPIQGVAGDPTSIDAVAREKYGWLAAYLDDPEIGSILRQAAEQNYTKEELQGALYPTKWWQTTQSSIRTWDAAERQDPATAEAQIQQQMADIHAAASQLGYSIDVGHLHDLARESLRLGWDQAQITNAIGAESLRNGRLSSSKTMQAIRQQVSDYGIPMSDATIQQWGEQIATGQATTEDLRQQLVGMAKGLFPGIADQLDKGLTVRQLADPYIQLAAQTLELNPDTIDFKDPRWSAALNGIDSKGVRRSLTLGEWQDKIRTDASYGWSKTKDATTQTFNLADTLGKAFGKVA